MVRLCRLATSVRLSKWRGVGRRAGEEQCGNFLPPKIPTPFPVYKYRNLNEEEAWWALGIGCWNWTISLSLSDVDILICFPPILVVIFATRWFSFSYSDQREEYTTQEEVKEEKTQIRKSGGKRLFRALAKRGSRLIVLPLAESVSQSVIRHRFRQSSKNKAHQRHNI